MGLVDDLRRREAENGRMRGAGLRFFLNHKGEISSALNKHFTVKAIYTSLVDSDKPPIAYRTFCEYVRQHIPPVNENRVNLHKDRRH